MKKGQRENLKAGVVYKGSPPSVWMMLQSISISRKLKEPVANRSYVAKCTVVCRPGEVTNNESVGFSTDVLNK